MTIVKATVGICAYALAMMSIDLPLSTAAGNLGTASSYEVFDLPQTPWPGFGDMVLDADGVAWVMANNRLFYFDGQRFREPLSGEMKSGQYLTGLYGGPARGAFATQPGDEDHQGRLFQLRNGRAEYLTTFYYDVSHDYPGIYISRDGRIFNWGRRFIAVYDDGNWRRIEAPMGQRPGLFHPAIFDLGTDVHFYSLRDNRFYHVDKRSEWKERDGPEWLTEINRERSRNTSTFATAVATQWRGGHVLIVSEQQPRLVAFDLKTGTRVDLSVEEQIERDASFADAYTLPNGEAWIVSRIFRRTGYTFYRLKPDGKLEEVTGTRDLPWVNTRRIQAPESLLVTRGGAIVFGLGKNGLAILRDGRLENWDWRYGFAEGVNHLHEGPGGEIWLSIGNRVARLTLGDTPPEPIEESADWEEIVLVPGSMIWQTSDEEITVFRADHPKHVSRWRSGNWRYQPMPFEANWIFNSILDDRGHLLVSVSAPASGHFDIGADSIERFDSMEAMLAEAQKKGARVFGASPGFAGIVHTQDNRLWVGDRGNRVSLFDGERWDELSFQDDVDAIAASNEFGALFRMQGGQFYRYNRGQMEELEPPLHARRALLLGPNGLQPFERPLVANRGEEYLPVLRVDQGLRLFSDLEMFEKRLEKPVGWSKSDDIAAKFAVELPQHVERLEPSPYRGAWLYVSQGAGNPHLLFAGRLEALDTSGTPLANKNISLIRQTSNGDMWYQTHFAGSPRALVLRQSNLTLTTESPPRECGRELEVRLLAEPERLADRIRLYTRLNADEFSSRESTDGKVTFRFPSSGRYRCEIVGVRLGGVIRSVPPFELRASVKLPDTVWESTGKPIRVEEIDWQPAISAKPTTEGVDIRILWRADEGPWKPLHESGVIPMESLTPGRHKIDFCAEEEAFWRDATPATLDVEYAPDYRRIVGYCVDQITGDDSAKAERARDVLRRLGPRAKQIIDEMQREAEEAARRLPQLRRLKLELERQQPADD